MKAGQLFGFHETPTVRNEALLHSKDLASQPLFVVFVDRQQQQKQ
jgi:hypothetical protein